LRFLSNLFGCPVGIQNTTDAQVRGVLLLAHAVAKELYTCLVLIHGSDQGPHNVIIVL
jgi:hypothetical protein